MLFFIILLTLFITCSPVSAQEFFDYPVNPILTKTGDSSAVAQPTVLKEESIFSIWFSDVIEGKVKISNMKSTNGIDWYDKSILTVSNNSTLVDPFMFRNGNQYYLYYGSYVNGAYSIWMSISEDGKTFIPNLESKIISPEATWEKSNITGASVIKDNDMFYLFYAGNGSSDWAIGLATSIDGVNWTKCKNNPFVYNAAGNQVIKYNNIFYLFFHTAQGVEVQQTDTLNGCDTVWTNRRVTNLHFSDPAPIQVGDDLWVYGFSNTSSGMTIWLAANVQIPKPEYPVVIIPGMFSSWNKDAILHNSPVSPSSWKLNPGVSEYEAIKQTLINLGRVENTDFFVFPYDWRKPINETTSDLDTFLTSKIWTQNPYQPISLVGHSLGGVVGRVYADKNPTKPIKQVVTAGSPHLGMVQAYKPLSTGVIERENSLSWIAMKLMLLLNRTLLQSDKDTIAERFPVLFDILPAFPFLKNATGAFIASPLVNSLLEQYPIKPSPSIKQTYIGGTGLKTLAGYTPSSSWTSQDGDGSVLTVSHLNSFTPAPLQNHGEVIYSKDGIKNILRSLNISVTDNEIPLGNATGIFPAIMLFIKSPATMQLIHNESVLHENEGMIWQKNAENGEYILKIKGVESGSYTVSIWLIGQTDDKWIEFTKQTTSGQLDEYRIIFNESSGGAATELVPPTPTRVPTITPSPRPTNKPQPTKKPCPTKKPTPTKTPPKHNNGHHFGHYIQIIIKYVLSMKKR